MKDKVVGLIALAIVYILAAAIGVVAFMLLDRYYTNDLLNILIADVLATIFVWACGLLLKTASTYDPYWSVQTIIIYFFLLIRYQNFNLGTILLLSAIALYSIRLTTNFIIGFDSLKYVDWRYKMLKEKSGPLYQLVNLFGICMFPTLVVYSASIPAFLYARMGSFSWFNLIGIGVILLGTLLELISDIQMKKFIKQRTSREEVINIGLWKYSRHPNYLGEILIWFGVGLVFIVSFPQYWYFFLGAILNFLMFLFISIPMEENHMKEYKKDIDKYIKTTSALLLLPRRKEID